MERLTKVSMHRPCADWVEKLAARHPDDVSPTDRRALNEHLTRCATCNEVYATYKALEAGMRCLSKESIPEFSYEPLEAVRRPLAARFPRSLSSSLLLLLTTLTTLYLRICWSQCFQAVHTWVLVILGRFPSRIAYASTGNHFLYA